VLEKANHKIFFLFYIDYKKYRFFVKLDEHTYIMVHVLFFVKIFWYFEICFFGRGIICTRESNWVSELNLSILLSLKVHFLLLVLFWTIIRVLYWETNHLNNIWNLEKAIHILLPIVVLVSEKDMWLKAVFILEIINFLSLWERQPHTKSEATSSQIKPRSSMFITLDDPSKLARAG
jgi:hypothetical protein